MEISNLIKTFEFELKGRRYRENSIENYISCISLFLSKFKSKDSVKHISEQDIKNFLYGFEKHNTQRGYHSAIKAFYKYVAKQPDKFKYIQYCPKSEKLPIVLSIDEMQLLINESAANLKHQSVICLMYSTAIRISEVISLKIENIDTSRMVINILDAKGGKDRNVTLDKSMLDLITKYISIYTPDTYLFNGQGALQYSERSIGQFLQKYADLAGLQKRVYPHLLRHTSATHLLEQGTEITIIQKILGHASVKTTQIYTHISHNLISKIPSPLQNIKIA